MTWMCSGASGADRPVQPPGTVRAPRDAPRSVLPMPPSGSRPAPPPSARMAACLNALNASRRPPSVPPPGPRPRPWPARAESARAAPCSAGRRRCRAGSRAGPRARRRARRVRPAQRVGRRVRLLENAADQQGRGQHADGQALRLGPQPHLHPLAPRSTAPAPSVTASATATRSASRGPCPRSTAARISLWGDSNSAEQILVLAAVLDGIAAVAAMTPSCGAEAAARPGRAGVRGARETLERGEVAGTPGTTAGPLPVVSWDLARHRAHLEPLSAFRCSWSTAAGTARAGPTTPRARTRRRRRPSTRASRRRTPACRCRWSTRLTTRCRAPTGGHPRDLRGAARAQGGGRAGGGLRPLRPPLAPSAWFDRVSTLQSAFLVKHLATRHAGPP
jgi:hypothetical protein